MKDFTFYDIYYTAITTLSDEEAGKFIKRICAYTVFETEENGGDDVTQPDQSEEPVASENENIDDDDTVPLDQTEEPTASDSEDNSIDDVTQLDQTEEPSAFESEADWG